MKPAGHTSSTHVPYSETLSFEVCHKSSVGADGGGCEGGEHGGEAGGDEGGGGPRIAALCRMDERGRSKCRMQKD